MLFTFYILRFKNRAHFYQRKIIEYIEPTLYGLQEKFKKNNQFLSEKRAEKWRANLQDPYFDEMN